MASSENWQRLVRAALKRDGAVSLAIAVPPSPDSTDIIEQVLQAADDIEDDDPNVARIICEQAYTMARNLDPSRHLRGVLQFKTGMESVIKQKLAKKDGASIDRQNDIEVLWNFYLEYKSRHRLDDMQRELERMRESGTFSTEMGARVVEMENIYATLTALLDVLKILVGQAPTNRLARQILEEKCISELKDGVAKRGDPLHESQVDEVMPEGEPDGATQEDPILGTEHLFTESAQEDIDPPQMQSNDQHAMQEDLLNETHRSTAHELGTRPGEGGREA